MEAYIDIYIRPQPELPDAHIMGNLYGMLHLAMAKMESRTIGISFPKHDDAKPSLGEHLRLHGPSENLLEEVVRTGSLSRLKDYLSLSEPRKAPVTAQYRCVQRVQAKSSPERLRRRQMRRHGYSESEARSRIPDNAAKILSLPYVHVRSLSTGQFFRLFIRHGPLFEKPQAGIFSAYGFSHEATIPWF